MRKQFARLVGQFARDERGASMLEYTILLGLITAAVITLVTGAGTFVKNQWQNLADQGIK